MESQPKTFSPGKRLYELLQEQQEPFLLKPHQPSINCWPTEACAKFLRFSSHGFKRKLRKALNMENRVPVDRISSSSGFFAAIKSQNRFYRLLHSCEDVLDGKRRCKTMADSKHLSPVSVFELLSDEGCSAHYHSMEEENTSTSSLNPETTDEEQHYEQKQENQHFQQCGKEFGERLLVSRESLGDYRGGKAMEVQVVSLGAGGQAEWIDVEGFGTTAGEEWKRFGAEVMEIGLVIESFIFDEITEEVVVEMMLGSHCFVQRVFCNLLL